MLILYAEDDPDIREALTFLLKKRGYAVDEVKNGEELLRKLGAGSYDLVLTDNDMPLMTGMQALSALRADARFTDLPVIVFSGNPDVKQAVEAARGVYVLKGGPTRDLYSAIDTLKPTSA